MKFLSFVQLFGERWLQRKTTRKQRRRRHPRTLVRPRLEGLEDRTLLSTLPLPQVGAQQQLAGDAINPVVAIDPVNPNKVVAVYNSSGGGTVGGVFSYDGGHTWGTFLAPSPFNNLFDPTLQNTRFTQATNPSIAFDRGENLYLVMTQHNSTFTSNALVLDKFNFSGPSPTILISGEELQHSTHDPFLNPVVAIDSNVTAFTDPNTGFNQFDPTTGQTVWVSWNTNNATPSQVAGSPLDVNGFLFGTFDPNIIKVMASSDGGNTFTNPVVVSQTHGSTDPNYGSQRDANPQIAFAQGTSDGSIRGGQMSFLWDDFGRGQLTVNNNLPSLNTPQAYNVSQSYSLPPNVTGNILDATWGGKDKNGNPLSDIASTTTFTANVNITNPNFTTLSNLTVTLALQEPHLNQISIELIAPNGQTVQLLRNRIDSLGNTIPPPPSSPQGIADNNSTTVGLGTTPFASPGTVFDQTAARPITDPGASAPYVDVFRPEQGGLNFGGLEVFDGLTAKDLNGVWTLKITDFRNDSQAATPPPQLTGLLSLFQLNFGSGLTSANFGTDTTAVQAGPFSSPGDPVRGAANAPYPLVTTSSPKLGVGPGAVIAIDNTLGSYSPNQGRMYIAYTGIGTNSGLSDDTDIYLIASSDGGKTWTALGSIGGAPLPVRVNSDQASDNFSEGNRAQFQPAIAVDPVTGTLVMDWYDGRWDSARARVTTYITTSIDGGQTFSAQTFLNAARSAIDAPTGSTVTLDPIPTNIGAASANGVGITQALAVWGGNVIPIWSGNQDTSGASLQNSPTAIAAGPRVVNGDQGPVTQDGSTGTYNTTFGADGTRQLNGFTVTFDRPVDPSTITASQVNVEYRSPTNPASSPPVNISSSITGVQALDINGPVSLSVGDAIVREPASGTATAVFTVYLTQPQLTDTTVDYTTTDGTALAGADYTAVAGTLLIPKGKTSATVAVAILPGTVVKGNRSFTLDLSNPSVGSIAKGSGTAIIVDTAGPPALSVGDATVLEGPAGGGNTATFTVYLSNSSSQQITVNYSTADGTAKAGVDYTAKTGTLIFAPNSTTPQTFTVNTIGDQLQDGNLTFSVNLSAPTNAVVARPQGTGTILDTNGLGISVGDAVVQEGNSGSPVATFTIYLNALSQNPVQVQYATQDGTGPNGAHAGTDYLAVFNTATIAAGSYSTTVNVPIIPNTIAQPNRFFFFNLSSPAGGALLRAQGVGTIIDDDAQPAISVSDANVADPASGTATANFTVTLSAPTTSTVTVQYATADGTAVGGTDYTAIPTTTLTFLPGQTSKTVPVTVLANPADLLPGADFFLKLTSPSNATIAKAAGTGTIAAAGGLTAVSVGDVSVAAGGSASFTVWLSDPVTSFVTVKFATADGTAVAGTDYFSNSGTLIFSPGQLSQTVTVGTTAHPGADNLFFSLNLSSPANASIARPQAVATIYHDQPRISVGDVTIVQPTSGKASAVFTVYVDRPAYIGNVTVGYKTVAGTAVAGTDYTTTTGTLTIPAGALSATVAVPILGGTAPGGNKTFTLQLSGASGGAPIVRATGTATIVSNNSGILAPNGAALPVLTAGDVTVLEPSQGQQAFANFNVFLSTPAAQTFTVQYTTVDGTAAAGTDYTLTSGTLTFVAGQASASVAVPLLNDGGYGPSKTFTLQLSNSSGPAILRATGTATVVDLKEAQPTLAIDNVVGLEPDLNTTTNYTFTVLLSEAVPYDVLVSYTTIDGTALSTGMKPDYTAVSGVLDIRAGSRSATISVPVIGSQTLKQNEFFSVYLSNPLGATIVQPRGTGAIGAPIPQATISDGMVLESSGTVQDTFTVFLDRPASAQVSFNYTTQNISAIAGVDYTPTSGVLTFSPGQNMATITVPVLSNFNTGANKKFKVILSNPANAGIIRGTGIGEIVNKNDFGNPTIAISNPMLFEGNSGSTNAVFTVYMSSPVVTQDVVLNWATADGSAKYLIDYGGLQTGTVTIPKGLTSAIIDIPVIGNTIPESNKTFTLTLSSPPPGVTIPSGEGTGTCTIVNDDISAEATGTIVEDIPQATIGDAMALNPPTGNTSTFMTFNVFLDRPSPNPITMSYSTVNGTAAGGTDFVAISNQTLTFLPGQSQKQILVQLIHTTATGPNKQFTVTLSSPVNVGLSSDVLPPPNTSPRIAGTGEIVNTNDGGNPTVAISNAFLYEPQFGQQNAVFTVFLSSPVNSQAVTLNWKASDISALTGIDYAGGSGQVVIPAGLQTGTFTVPVFGETHLDPNQFFNVTLSLPNPNPNPANVTIPTGEGKALAVLVNQNRAPLVSVGDATVVRNETSTVFAQLTAYLSNQPPSGQTEILEYTTADGTGPNPARAGIDYTGTSGRIAFPAGTGNTVQTFFIPILPGTQLTGNRSFTVYLFNPAVGDVGRSATVTIVDPNTLPISVSDATVQEANGNSPTATFTIYLGAVAEAPVTVQYATANGTAKAGTDYTPVANTATIPMGQSSVPVNVPILPQTSPVGNRTFFLNLTSPNGGYVERPQGVGTIIDGNAVPAVSVGDATVQASTSGTVTATFTAYLNFAPTAPVTVNWATADNTATAVEGDYTPAGGPITFNPGQTSQTFTVTVGASTAVEADESYFVNLTLPVGATNATLLRAQGVGTIVGSVSTPPALTIGDVTVQPGPAGSMNATFTVYLSQPSSQSISVNYSTADGTATAGEADYVPKSGTLNFGIGQTSQSFTVQVNGNSRFEGAPGYETFLVNLTSPVNAVVARPQATGTIIDSGGTPGTAGATQFLVSLAPQSATGTYSYTIGPSVQDRIRAVGSGVTPVGAPVSFDFTSFSSGISDGQTTTLTLPVSGFGSGLVVSSVTLGLTIDYPATGDLKISLVAPDGSSILLFNRRPSGPGSGDTGLGFGPVVFDDSVTEVLAQGQAPFEGTFRPEEPLGGFKGRSPNGTWKLVIADAATGTGNTGVVTDANLTIQAGTPGVKPGNAMDQNANGVAGEQPDTSTNPGYLGDDFAAPTPTVGGPFQLPYSQDTLPLIIPGPHVVRAFVPGNPILPQGAPATFTTTATVPFTDNTVVRAPVTVSDFSPGQVISAMTVFVNIAGYPRTGDLVLTLIAPDGARLTLFNQEPGAGGGATGGQGLGPITFDDTSTVALSAGTAPYNGTFRPDTPLADFRNYNPNGTWQLEIADLNTTNTGDVGNLVSWALTIQGGNSDNEVLNGTAGSMYVVFDRDINPATFMAAQVLRMVGPLGPITPTAANPFVITPDPAGTLPGLANRTFQISFPATQIYSGNYTLTLGAGITSAAGDQMDNNFNAGLDVLRGANPSASALAQVSFTTHPGNTTTIVPNATTVSTIAVPNAFVVQGVTLTLNITYPKDQDLQIILVAPDQTAVQLFSNFNPSSSSTANFTATTFSDSALTPIQQGVPPYSFGPYNPQFPLSGLIGHSSAGNWTLVIRDSAASVSGQHTLDGWTLNLFEAVPGTGLGEAVADQTSAGFRIFTMDPTNALSHQNYTPVGPTPTTLAGQKLAGSVSAVAVDPSDPSGNTVYVGASSGGIWKTTNFLTNSANGPSYVPLTDFGPTTAVNTGSILVLPHNNDPLQSILFVATGDGDTGTPGVGFLVSPDGGNSWGLFDSLNNVDSTTIGQGNITPINASTRTHDFVGTQIYRLVADPTKITIGGNLNTILYAATSKGLYQSLDTGRHWQLLQSGVVTDVLLAPGSAGTDGTLQIVYAAIEGVGVFMSTNRGSSFLQMLGNQGHQFIRDFDNYPNSTPIPVTTPGSLTPNGAFGRITLATPALSGNPLLDFLHTGFLYAAVSTADGTNLQGLFVTKDAGNTWTRVALPTFAGFGTTDNIKATINPVQQLLPPHAASPVNNPNYPNVNSTYNTARGNYALSLAVDPTNPNVVYLGGVENVRVDLTALMDGYNETANLLDANDGGQTYTNTIGALTLKFPALPYGFVPIDPNTGQPQGFAGTTNYLNLLRDPNNPFVADSILYLHNVSFFNNSILNATGPVQESDVSWEPFNAGLAGSYLVHQIVTVKDPLTGHARLYFADEQGVYSGVDQGGTFTAGVGMANLPLGNRNGDLQIAQLFESASQPSTLAADIAGAMFYATSNGTSAQSTSDILRTGNLTWANEDVVPLSATGVATDATGTGVMYQYQWPCCDQLVDPARFFQITQPGAVPVSRVTNLLQAGDNPFAGVGNWKEQAPPPNYEADQKAGTLFGTFAVNPIDPNAAVIGSRPFSPGPGANIFRNTGLLGNAPWFVIGRAQDLDGTYAQSLAFGAPPVGATGNLDDFIYAGTVGGNVFVTFTGGGSGGGINAWTKLAGSGTNVLDGSPIMQVVPDPNRGSHDLYVVTQKGVYFMADSSAATTTWTNITGNLFSLSYTPFNNNSLVGQQLQILTSGSPSAVRQLLTTLAADWRFAVNGKPPVLYVGAESGVFRSTNGGATWTIFPDVTHDGAVRDGGLLPDARIMDLQVVEGNVIANTGLTDQSAGPNILLVTTYGRGDFAIRLPNGLAPGPRVLSVVASTPGQTPMTQATITFAGPVDPQTFTLSKIVSLKAPDGTLIAPISVADVTPPPAPGKGNLHNVYQVTFPPQTKPGAYVIVLGPNITDVAGDKMDQNNNGIDGEATDTFTGYFYFTTGASVNPTDPTGTHGPFVPALIGINGSNGQVNVLASNGNNAFTGSVWTTLPALPPSLWTHILYADFNGDGKTDMASYYAPTGQWVVWTSNGSSFTESIWGQWYNALGPTAWVDVVAGNFDGSGRASIAGRFAPFGTVWVARSTGNSFVTSFWGTWATGVTWANTLVGDFNGDGMDDLVSRVAQNGAVWVAESTGSSFVQHFWQQWATGITWVDVVAGHFSGGKATELAERVSEFGSVWVSTGYVTGGFTAPGQNVQHYWQTWYAPAGQNVWADVRVGDFSGDGRDGLVARLTFNDALGVSLDFDPNRNYATNPDAQQYWGSWPTTTAWGNVVVGDFNGDGKMDLAERSLASGAWYVSLSTGSAFGQAYWGVIWDPSVQWLNVAVGSSGHL
jgi:subtilisin-like proprotein convertase family protein